jgi:hypothetical protein
VRAQVVHQVHPGAELAFVEVGLGKIAAGLRAIVEAASTPFKKGVTARS